VTVIVKIIAMPIFGRVLQRTSLRKVITISALGIAPIPLMWLVSDSFWWFLVINTYTGVAWAGFELGMLMALFDADDDAERTSIQVAFSALQAIGAAGASLIGGFILDAYGTDQRAYLAVFVVSSIARFVAVMLLVRRLPMLLVRLPFTVVTRAWTMAEDLIRPRRDVR
jgi:MFS family permease